MTYAEFGQLTPELWQALQDAWITEQEIKDRRTALVCSVFSSCMGGKQVPVTAFMPQYRHKEKLDSETLKRKAMVACARMGGTIYNR